jgi:2-methylcitrate dehydratase
VSLAAVHAEPVSNWKGISPAITCMRAVYVTMLAGRGITGPKALFDGPHGLVQLLDQPLDFRTADRSLNSVEATYLKQYCSLIHGQAAIDAVLALRTAHGLTADDVAAIDVDVFQAAYDFAGGGAYGPKDSPLTKEQADYNLKYLCAVAMVDGAVGPAQLETSRVVCDDVQQALRHVTVTPADDLTARYPERTSVRVRVTLHDGRQFRTEESDFEGSPTRPMHWERVVEKFHWLAEPFCDDALRADVVAAVDALDSIEVSELTALLAKVSPTPLRPRTRHRL